MVTTYSLRGLHGRVVDELGSRIVRGEIPPGTVIDPEALASDMDVSRTLMREAIKVLTAKGLVDARPRTGTRVLDRDVWNLLDPDVMRWRDGGDPDARLLKELEEVRQVFEPGAARLAARRRNAQHLATLSQALDDMARAELTIEQHVAADIKFHRTVLQASGNELLGRLEIVFVPALRARDTLIFQHGHDDEFLRLHKEVFEAIEGQTEDAAFTAMLTLLHAAADDTTQILNMRKNRTATSR